jgi:hypothetical protein
MWRRFSTDTCGTPRFRTWNFCSVKRPGEVMYKWSADEVDFCMPVRVGSPDHWQIIHPTKTWQSMESSLTKTISGKRPLQRRRK